MGLWIREFFSFQKILYIALWFLDYDFVVFWNWDVRDNKFNTVDRKNLKTLRIKLKKSILHERSDQPQLTETCGRPKLNKGNNFVHFGRLISRVFVEFFWTIFFERASLMGLTEVNKSKSSVAQANANRPPWLYHRNLSFLAHNELQIQKSYYQKIFR